MITLKYQVLILTILLFANSCKSPTNMFYFDSEEVDSLEENDNWYYINTQREIKKCNPKIEFVKDEENDFEGNILTLNEVAILIFNSKKKFDLNNKTNQKFETQNIGIGNKIQINENIVLHAKSIIIDEDEILSFEIEDKARKEKYEIFRNCRVITDVASYFGCGRLPFRIDFVGDIINDKNPEIILSADKEVNVLKLVVGFKDDKYKVLRWTEFE